MFILAASGSAVGLGNIWRFPYVAGENGGGAFVIVYLACIFLIGIPILSSEILLGREGRQSPIHTMKTLTKTSGANGAWQFIGWMGALAGFVILSYYSVVAGWAMAYVFEMGSGVFVNADGATASQVFADFTGSPGKVVLWHSIFMLLTMFIVARGITEGLERTVKYLMPALFALLLVLVGYAMNSGHFMEGVAFLFSFDFDKLTGAGVLMAMGQAFFTLSLGMGAIMTYGAYMPKDASILSSATSIALIDTSMALLSGLVIFPLVFANGLESSAGPGLMFVTIPIAFGSMSGGTFFGVMFFVLVSFAAITSAISLVEPALAWFVEKLNTSRRNGAIVVCTIAWALGLGSAFSTNIGSELYLLPGMTFFDSMDYVSNNIMLPLGGMLIALFTGWFLSQDIVARQLQISGGKLIMFKVLVRFVAPIGVGLVFINTFI
jgi:NSS family neurotransmitter:Na+ symporter|tara:strand:+ start:1778 stop:3085 length:1308 start_codon:yes stop_codon:yes gene_type:complete